MTRLYFDSFYTAFGNFAIVWGHSEMIRKIYLPNRVGDLTREYPSAEPNINSNIRSVIENIVKFLDGQDVRFGLEQVALDDCSCFQRKVLLAEHAIPRGFVSTYQRIAERVGCPRGARAVGRALAANPFPVIIPCHRAVRSDGGLGGYQGGLEMKKRLLEMEGVSFIGEKADMAKVYY